MAVDGQFTSRQPSPEILTPRQASAPTQPAPVFGRKVNKQALAAAISGYSAGSPTPTVSSNASGCLKEDFSQRPRTHCGYVHTADEVVEVDEMECVGAGAIARGLAGNCRSCIKLRLKLEHEERARVKAQEQLATLHAENLRLRGEFRACSTFANNTCNDRPMTAQSRSSYDRSGSTVTASASLQDLDAVGGKLEGYRREVELLRDALRERDLREASFIEQQRRQREEHDSATLEWQAQLAGLVCEVQDLEARNEELETSLRASRLAVSPSVLTSAGISTTASVSRASSEANASSVSGTDGANHLT